MKNNFTDLIQKCICLDLSINSLIHSNSYQHLDFLYDMKHENLRNIKVICYVYKYIFKESVVDDEFNSLELSKMDEHNLDYLLQVNLNILSSLEILKKSTFDVFILNIIDALNYSYFNFISLVQYFYPSSSSKNSNNITNENKYLNYKNFNNIRFFDISADDIQDDNTQNISIDSIYETSINAINIFFNYALLDNQIVDEFYEVFFENNPNNKFFQYFFKTSDKIFKIRILNKTGKIFYLYQKPQDKIQISPSLNKEESKKLVDKYLKEKFKSEFENLIYDKNYINSNIYNNSIESYKFKYNYNNKTDKNYSSKGFYITINTSSAEIEEISLF